MALAYVRNHVEHPAYFVLSVSGRISFQGADAAFQCFEVTDRIGTVKQRAKPDVCPRRVVIPPDNQSKRLIGGIGQNRQRVLADVHNRHRNTLIGTLYEHVQTRQFHTFLDENLDHVQLFDGMRLISVEGNRGSEITQFPVEDFRKALALCESVRPPVKQLGLDGRIAFGYDDLVSSALPLKIHAF